jgi:NTE family protein
MTSVPLSIAPLSIVLGAGGPLATVFHLGLLSAFHDVGIELADAERVIATSAGAGIAASILAGATLEDTRVLATTPPDAAARERMRATLTQGRRGRRPLAPALAREALLGGRGLSLALSGVLPSGRIPTAPMSRYPSVVGALDWPSTLWIPATRIPDGERVVFGRDLIVPLADAVEASAAVPALFVPKIIGSERYVDGAVRSANSADLAGASAAELVLVSSVQTRPGLSPLRREARSTLAKELTVLRRAGKRVILLEPNAELLALAVGFPMRSAQNGPALIDAAARQAAAALAAHIAS